VAGKAWLSISRCSSVLNLDCSPVISSRKISRTNEPVRRFYAELPIRSEVTKPQEKTGQAYLQHCLKIKRTNTDVETPTTTWNAAKRWTKRETPTRNDKWNDYQKIWPIRLIYNKLALL